VSNAGTTSSGRRSIAVLGFSFVLIEATFRVAVQKLCNGISGHRVSNHF
jgi:hypothetical protein